MLSFVDETGKNPLPVGIIVSVYQFGQPFVDAALVGVAIVELDGSSNIDVQSAVPYTATFIGTQAPAGTADFVGSSDPLSPTLVVVPGYRSTARSADGYADFVRSELPLGWIADADTQPGGNTYPILRAAGAVLENVDQQNQSVRSMLRLPSAIALDVDSWVRDFFGSNLQRYPSEPDAQYIARIIVALRSTKCTLRALNDVVVGFYNAIEQELIEGSTQNLGEDTQGGFDTRGGADQSFDPPSLSLIMPQIAVFDAQSRPDLAAQYGIAPPQFAILIAFVQPAPSINGFVLDQAFLDHDAFLMATYSVNQGFVAPDARLGQMVGMTKAQGTQPVYIVATVPA